MANKRSLIDSSPTNIDSKKNPIPGLTSDFKKVCIEGASNSSTPCRNRIALSAGIYFKSKIGQVHKYTLIQEDESTEDESYVASEQDQSDAETDSSFELENAVSIEDDEILYLEREAEKIKQEEMASTTEDIEMLEKSEPISLLPDDGKFVTYFPISFRVRAK